MLQFKYAFWRLKRASNKLQNDRFVDSILQGGVNIFQEIKKFCRKSRNCSNRIDDEIGSTNIANHFAGIYSNLYNQAGTEDPWVAGRAQLQDKQCRYKWDQQDWWEHNQNGFEQNESKQKWFNILFSVWLFDQWATRTFTTSCTM